MSPSQKLTNDYLGGRQGASELCPKIHIRPPLLEAAVPAAQRQQPSEAKEETKADLTSQ